MGQNQPICITSEQQNNQQYNWCFYEAFDTHTIVVQIAFLVALIITFTITTIYFKRLLRLLKKQKYKKLFGQGFLYVYILIYAWLIASIIKVVLNIFVYFLIMLQQTQPPTTSSPVVIFSTIFMFLDYSCPFSLLFLMLLIPYQWTNQLLLNTSQKQTISKSLRIRINWYFQILKFIKIYFTWIRSWFLLLIIVQPFFIFFFNVQRNCQIPKLNAILVYIDTLIIFVVYLFAYHVGIFMQKKSLIIVQKKDQKRIKIQFSFLFGVLLLRICLNLYFKFVDLDTYKPTKNCSDFGTQSLPGLIFLILAQFFMHLLPIITILYIHRPSIEQRKRDQKILNGKWQQSQAMVDDSSNDQFSIATQYSPKKLKKSSVFQ